MVVVWGANENVGEGGGAQETLGCTQIHLGADEKVA